MSKAAFLQAYQSELIAEYGWAKDPNKLARFMSSVKTTLTEDMNTWNRSGEAYKRALKACNLPLAISLRALRALPEV